MLSGDEACGTGRRELPCGPGGMSTGLQLQEQVHGGGGGVLMSKRGEPPTSTQSRLPVY